MSDDWKNVFNTPCLLGFSDKKHAELSSLSKVRIWIFRTSFPSKLSFGTGCRDLYIKHKTLKTKPLLNAFTRDRAVKELVHLVGSCLSNFGDACS